MNSRNVLIVSAVLYSLLSGTAEASPQNGFSLNAGLASHSMNDPGGSYNTSGLSIGLDYQFALSDKLSISPFLMSSGESTNISGITAGHGILGVQLRYWVGDMFFGGHLGSYSEVTTNGNLSISANGGGAGLVMGWERPDEGLYVMGQIDSATVKYAFWDTKLSGLRLSMGYRWK